MILVSLIMLFFLLTFNYDKHSFLEKMNLSLAVLLFCLCILLCDGQLATDGVKPSLIPKIDQNPPLKFSRKYRQESRNDKQKHGHVLVRPRNRNQQRVNVGTKTKND